MAFGSNGSSSSSAPLTGQQREDIYKYGVKDIASVAPNMFSYQGGQAAQGDAQIWDPHAGGREGYADGMHGWVDATQGTGGWVSNPDYVPATQGSLVMTAPEYQSPTYTDPGAAKTLTAGDYDKLQADVLAGTTAGLDYSKGKDTEAANRDFAKRGMWSSGLATNALINQVDAAYAPQYEKAGADATSQRYALQSGELQGLNNYALAQSAEKNTVDQQNAQNVYNSQWAPANYLKDIYNQSGGTISSGGGSGMNVAI